MGDDLILLGVIGRPHGVRGHVRVTSYCAEPADLTAYGPLSDGAGRRFVLRWVGDGIAAIEGVTDRDAAAALTNVRLHVPRAALPLAGPDEVYHADLVGLLAVRADGTTVGRVAAVEDYGAGAFLEIARDGGGALLLPFNRQSVPEIDPPGRRIVVDPPAETEARDAA